MLYHTRHSRSPSLNASLTRPTTPMSEAYVQCRAQPDDAQSYDVTCQLLLTHETLNVSLYLLSLFIALYCRDSLYNRIHILFLHLNLRFQRWIRHFSVEKRSNEIYFHTSLDCVFVFNCKKASNSSIVSVIYPKCVRIPQLFSMVCNYTFR